MSDSHPLLDPITVAGLQLANRVAVAPMSRVSTAGDGIPTTNMATYYAEYAQGGFGLVITEGTYTDSAHSQAYENQPGIVNSQQLDGWRRVVEAVHSAGARIFLQLMHAGALVQGNHYKNFAVAPSAVQPKGDKLRGYGGEGPYGMPREMTRADINQAIDGFAQSAARAAAAGFDGVEIHGANGYLLDQFLTRYTNLRSDEYGGSPGNRARLLVEVIEAIRDATRPDFPIGVRVSQVKVNDLEYRWAGVQEGRAIFARLKAAGPAYIHVASEGAPWEETSFLAPGVSITGLAKEVTGVPVIANGGMDDADRSERILKDGHADLVALGHGALANPDWPQRLASGGPFRRFDPDMLSPEVTIENSQAWRERQLQPAA